MKFNSEKARIATTAKKTSFLAKSKETVKQQQKVESLPQPSEINSAKTPDKWREIFDGSEFGPYRDQNDQIEMEREEIVKKIKRKMRIQEQSN